MTSQGLNYPVAKAAAKQLRGKILICTILLKRTLMKSMSRVHDGMEHRGVMGRSEAFTSRIWSGSWMATG
jgi:hypothetical protein